MGFSIDLWRSITDEMGMKSELFVNPTVADLLFAVKSDKADLGIAAISMTAERDKDFDFSYSIFESGLHILVRERLSGKGKVQVVGSLFRKESYGIVLPVNSPYRKPINNALLTLQENGTYQELYEKWFSSK